MENTDSTKHMINMKLVIIAAGIIGIAAILTIPLGNIDQRNVPINLIMVNTVLTGILLRIIQNPPIKEFFYRKLSQKRTNFTELFFVFKSFVRKIRNIKVDVQTPDK